MTNERARRMALLKKTTLLAPVCVPAVVVAVLLIVGTVSNPERAGEAFSATLEWITRSFGWFYMLAVTLFLLFVVFVALSRWGDTRLGPDHAEPQYSFPSWFAMLFSAGYGIALLFFGVAEPVMHYSAPPAGDAETIDAAKQAMQITFFHWGFHIWGIYGITGLVLAYFAFRHGLPLSLRSALYPLIGERIKGPIGHTVDVVAILGTLFGIATTLGLSVAQINAGMNYLWPSVPIDTGVQIVAIAVITGLTALSVGAGLDKGVKRLSILNMVLAGTLMAFVFLAGPSLFILDTLLQNTGSYLSNIVERTFSLQAYERSDWIGNWTLFIFGWTIAWAPFVGLFIARISRGRTIREFVLGVLFVPTIFTFLWFSIFGDTALHLIMVDGYTALIDEVQADKAVALFKVFEQLPFSGLVSFVTVILIVTFFVTSSDSGALVIDALASGGVTQTPAFQRVFWAVLQGVVAASLLLAGGLSALQTMSVAAALPFSIVLLVSAVGMWRALSIEGHRSRSLSAHMHGVQRAAPGGWKKRLGEMIDFPAEHEVVRFINDRAGEAMQSVAVALRDKGWPAEVLLDAQNDRVGLSVVREDEIHFLYEVRLRACPKPDFARTSEDDLYYRADVFMRNGGLDYDLYGCSTQEIIDDILAQFGNYLHFLHTSPGVLPWDTHKHDDMLVDAPESKM